MKNMKTLAVYLPVLALALTSCDEKKEKARPAAAEKAKVPPVDKAMLASFKLPKDAENPKNPSSKEKIDLGRALYYDTRLSADNTVSCNTCHALNSFGDDASPVSTGIKGQKGGRSAPTVFNAALHIAQFWDGREPDVEAQAKGPVLNPIEMGMPDGGKVIEKLKAVPAYVEMFKAAFPGDTDPVTYDNLGNAIGAFERKLLTPSRFDAYLDGDDKALTDVEKQGLNEFVQAGCISCHFGPAIGGGIYQKVGLIHPWPGLKDRGRAEITGNAAEEFMFKVPTLRNVAETAPYGHDGRVPTLNQMVKDMAHYQLGKELTDDQVGAIAAFLKSLTGQVDEDYVKEPKLP